MGFKSSGTCSIRARQRGVGGTWGESHDRMEVETRVAGSQAQGNLEPAELGLARSVLLPRALRGTFVSWCLDFELLVSRTVRE